MNKLTEQAPRLTDLPGPKHPHRCQRCGRAGRSRWQECDHQDQPEHRVVVLCEPCAVELVDPHPRLYVALHPNAPWPGCMELCLSCKHRNGVSCTHPNAKANGGEGVSLTVCKPATMFVDGTRNGKRFGYHAQIYGVPPQACAQYEPCQDQPQ